MHNYIYTYAHMYLYYIYIIYIYHCEILCSCMGIMSSRMFMCYFLKPIGPMLNSRPSVWPQWPKPISPVDFQCMDHDNPQVIVGRRILPTQIINQPSFINDIPICLIVKTPKKPYKGCFSPQKINESTGIQCSHTSNTVPRQGTKGLGCTGSQLGSGALVMVPQTQPWL